MRKVTKRISRLLDGFAEITEEEYEGYTTSSIETIIPPSPEAIKQLNKLIQIGIEKGHIITGSGGIDNKH